MNTVILRNTSTVCVHGSSKCLGLSDSSSTLEDDYRMKSDTRQLIINGAGVAYNLQHLQ